MRRVLQFLRWKVGVWQMRAEFLQHDADTAERSTSELLGSRLLHCYRVEGARAYGYRQAAVQQKLHDHFWSLWQDVPSLVISRIGRKNNGSVTDLDSFLLRELSLAAAFLRL
jgi:hypothetical protein